MTEMTDTATLEVTEVGEKLAGKYLTFKLAEEEYGLQILKVQEIIQMQEVTRVPKTPIFVRGVINLRGKVIPVVELKRKFNMETSEDNDKTCIIVVQIGEASNTLTVGVIIDEVSEVLDIAGENIQETPSFGTSVDTDFILGMGKIGDNVKMLLDIDKVLTMEEVSALSKVGKK